ncbi:MAG TPA: hypothetical protein VF690_13780 [Hymenobacter sp.]
MTRATLLHVLEHTTSLGPAEVRELEQLAQAFPYCQTAHLLLAKAAHDQGTMLAGQRLRRAATYAADRTLLRRLIEQQAEPAVVAPIAAVEAPKAIASTAAFAPVMADSALVEQAEPEPVVETVATTALMQAISAEVVSTPVVVEQSIEPLAEPASFAAAKPEEFAGASASAAEAPESAETAPLLWDREGADISAAEIAAETIEPSDFETDLEGAELPVQAPAIRPPVEVGEARFEFGLAELVSPAAPAYELPDLVDELAVAQVTRSLGRLAPPAILPLGPPETSLAAPTFTSAAFTGDDLVGYAFGGGSRLGCCLQLLPLPNQAAAPTLGAGPTATPLPPTDAFFEPDPLLLAHWATHCPSPLALPSSLDLINNFLRRKPRLTRPAVLPPTASAQADLSVRSTRVEPELASESLARILVRQGKTARAIEIYEKLMVKQPEKMAYFAAQINQLQPPA